jgi:hypothetical protein
MPGEDGPVIDYANQKALDVFGYTWDEVTKMSPTELMADAAQVRPISM